MRASPSNATDPVRVAYSARAQEYAELLGSMEATHAADREFVLGWAGRCDGPIIDAGCGPGHWTEFLRLAGAEVSGIDAVPEFIDEARQRYPAAEYRRATLPFLDVPEASLGGVLAWYSLIHVDPAALGEVILALSKFLRPNGEILLGFFTGTTLEPFEHAVVTAYSWPIEELTRLLETLGFEITAVDAREDSDARPHGAISARLLPR